MQAYSLHCAREIPLPGKDGRVLLVQPGLFKRALLGLSKAQLLQHRSTFWRDVDGPWLLYFEAGTIPQMRPDAGCLLQ